ncbi:MAG: hypothetical protein MI746_09475 [Pseudomonadales bacterium]|nr:hypothetical protein [Pseudomonadales bacterium]
MPSVTDSLEELPDLDVLLATLLYLMSRHTHSPNSVLSQSIITHLEILKDHPDCSSPALSKAGKRLTKHWNSALQAQRLVGGPTDQVAKLNALWKVH